MVLEWLHFTFSVFIVVIHFSLLPSTQPDVELKIISR
jgi:hypothetical protein